MNRKLATIIFCLILILSGVIYFSNKESAPSSSSHSPESVANITSSYEAPEYIKNSLLNEVTSQALIAVSFYPQKLTPVADHFTKLKTKLSQTKLWKLNNTDSLLENAENQIKKSAKTDSLASLLTNRWREISELSFAALDDPKNSNATSIFPKIIIELKTSTPSFINEIRTFLKNKTPLSYNKNSLNIQLTSSTNADEYLLTLSSEKNNASIHGKISMQNDVIQVLINSSLKSEFAPHKDEPSHLHTTTQHTSPDEHTFMLYSINHEKMTHLVHEISQYLTLNHLSAPYGVNAQGLNSSHGSLSFNQGLHINQCLAYDPTLPLGAKYQALAHSEGIGETFSKLISDDTVLGITISSAYANLISYLFQRSYSDEVINEASKEPEIKKILDAFTNNQDLFSALPFKEAHFIVNTPQGGGFTPDAFILLSEPVKGSEVYLQKIKKFIDEIGYTSSASSFSKDLSGNDKLSIAFDPKFSLFVGYLKNGSVVFSPSETTIEMIEKKLEKHNSFSEAVTTQGESLGKIFDGSNFSLYIANRPIFEFGKPFLGLLSLGSPESKVTTTDINEALSLLEFIVTSTSQARELKSDILCFDSHSSLAEMKASHEVPQ